MKRREFITLAGGAAAAWPMRTFAQTGQLKRVGFLAIGADGSSVVAARIPVFLEALRNLGWHEGVNLNFDVRVARGGQDVRAAARELVALKPDAMLAQAGDAPFALRDVTNSIPIVFAGSLDPVGSGLVASMSRPGGNITGFLNFEFAVAGKWIALLREAAPKIKRILVLTTNTNSGTIGLMKVIEAASAQLGVEIVVAPPISRAGIGTAVNEFATRPEGGLLALSGVPLLENRDIIIDAAARNGLPLMGAYREFAIGGALMAYTTDFTDLYRKAAGYIDRILHGANPAELPVQAPTRYELIINLKAARALGLNLSQTLLVGADEVIE